MMLAAALGAERLPEAQALQDEIAARDAELFDIVFTRCDPVRLRALLAPDVEFYHDKGGFIFRSADDFVADHLKQCASRRKPDTWRSRRALVRETLVVDAVPGYGAMEAGDHLFYERKGNGPERLAGRSRFAMVWQKAKDGWRLSRVLSFSHKAK